MSSPVNEAHHDKRYHVCAAVGARDAKQPPDAIIAAIEQLRLERQRAAASADDAMQTQLREHDHDQTELPLAAASDPDDIEAAMADAVRASTWTPRSLDPVVMPEPPKPRLDGPTWGMVARLGGAVARRGDRCAVRDRRVCGCLDRYLARRAREREGGTFGRSGAPR